MQSCLSENVNVTAQTVHTWSHSLRFAGEKLATLGAKCQCVLEQNGIHLFAYMLMQLLHLEQISSRFLDLGSDWIKAPVFTPCFSGFGTPQRKGEDQWRQWKKSSEDTCLWFTELDHTTVRRWEWVTFLSFCLSLHHLDPLKVGTSRCPVRNLSFSCPSVAPHPLCTKTAQRAIWLWVMEGGLNSPSEILEPVGKPQLFKCRKSWFYKMLTWSAQGTGERMAEWKKPPSSTPTTIYLETESKGKGREAVTKEGEIKEDNYN